jgi:hypothetical protein
VIKIAAPLSLHLSGAQIFGSTFAARLIDLDFIRDLIPSAKLDKPARSTALICTKTSWPPSSSGWMKPSPLVPLNRFTMPIATQATIAWRL